MGCGVYYSFNMVTRSLSILKIYFADCFLTSDTRKILDEIVL